MINGKTWQEYVKSTEYQKRVADMNQRIDGYVEELHQTHGSIRLAREEARIEKVMAEGKLE